MRIPADLRQHRPQSVVGLDPVLQTMHVPLQLRLAPVAKRIDAANQFVELEDGLPCSMMPGQGAQLAYQGALAHLLEPERGHDAIDVGFLFQLLCNPYRSWEDRAFGCSHVVSVRRNRRLSRHGDHPPKARSSFSENRINLPFKWKKAESTPAGFLASRTINRGS
jgi:hypothetical protein